MKRNVKRLTLHRETVRHLNGEEMSAAQGGASGRTCPVTMSCLCTNTCYVSCDSCPTDCGQWYCEGV